MSSSLENLKSISQNWFETLRDQIVSALEQLESEFSTAHFVKTPWARPENGGGGTMEASLASRQ